MTRTEFLNKYTNSTTGLFRDNDQFEIEEVDLREFTADVKALLDVVGNDAPFPIKCVRYLAPPANSPASWREWATRSRLLPDSLCLGTICYSEFAPTDAEKETVLVWDGSAAPALTVWRDGSFAGVKVGAKWVPRQSDEAVAAGVEVFNPLKPMGPGGTPAYTKGSATVAASLVRHVIGGTTLFFTSLIDQSYTGGQPMYAPTGEVDDTRWRLSSKPSPFLVATHYEVFLNLQQNSKLERGRTYEIYDRPGDWRMVWGEFDELDSQFCYNARVQATAGLFVYDVVANTLTPAGGGEGDYAGQAFESASVSGAVLKLVTGNGQETMLPLPTGVTAAQLETVRSTVKISAVGAGDYTLQASDLGNLLPMDSPTDCVVRIPTDAALLAPVGTVVEVMQIGAGGVEIAGLPGVTVRSKLGRRISGQADSVGLIKYSANVWYVRGGVA